MSKINEDIFSPADRQFIEGSKNLATLNSSQLIPHTALVFSGGGAKGAIYAGVYAALEEAGVMANVSHNVGTSAGAITAAVLSTGISSTKFAKLSQETIFSELLGDGLITKSGIPLANLVKDTIQDNFSSYLNNQQDIPTTLQQRLVEVQNQKKLIEDDLARNVRSLEIFQQDNQQRIAQNLNEELLNNDEYEDIKNNLKFINNELNNISSIETKLNSLINNKGDDFIKLKQFCSEKGAKITFADLELMTIYDPKTFKNLTVTAVDKETGELKLFNSKDTPNVEISLAVKASFSIPLFFEPVVIDGVSYVDGGWVNNIPLNALEQGSIDQNGNDDQIVHVPNDPKEVEKVKNSGRILAFAFGNDMDSAANIAIYTSKKVIFDPMRVVKFLIDVVYKNLAGIGGNQKYSENENKTLEGVRKNSIDTLPLNTAKVGTLSFDLAAKKAEYLYIKGYCQTNNFLQNHAVDEKRDLRHDVRSFMLDVYDSSITKQENTWLSMVKSREEGVKSKELLSFCKADKWENEKTTKENFSEVIKKYVATTCLQSPPKKASENSKTVDILLEKLNSNNPLIISRDVKKEFCKAIKGNEISNLTNDPKYIDNLKISKDDIKKFLENNKQLVPTLQTSRAR